ncbi:DUF2771 family protein [Gordonia neofelifaecis]|uniref:DUF2771 domain-containing protein n=1 Tax=Gordonia neofelifaecis NRRL B-59395 TaxID=644548 RepID=F1YLX9_9ACTN|nr:DUF2771 family protein [Gordonia neofelifaecis]EGD54230.1 hypothetical protein SCNU_14616 [Gordonia neofelifaecis NRRL B-59395]
MQPADKKALTIIGAVVVAALVIIAGATALLVSGHEKPLPTVSFQAGDDLTRAEPSYWCSVQMDDCRGVDARGRFKLRTYDHPVAVGERVTLSVPKEVASGPWTLIAEYATPRGIQRVMWLHMPDTMYTQILHSEPRRVLMGVEISSISAYREKTPGMGGDTLDADFSIRGTFSIRTLPVDFRIFSTRELPDQRG